MRWIFAKYFRIISSDTDFDRLSNQVNSIEQPLDKMIKDKI